MIHVVPQSITDGTPIQKSRQQSEFMVEGDFGVGTLVATKPVLRFAQVVVALNDIKRARLPDTGHNWTTTTNLV
ncbi:hypothetical protein ACH5RR_012667 [Cinchona calisaya]|uniref:Uncharacterized protein n=1 Tax=Cinchona calisaya TaxID=153742 RepID=A0ABD3AAS5_9GENT